MKAVLSTAVGMFEREMLEWVTKVPASVSNRKAKNRVDDFTTMQDILAVEL